MRKMKFISKILLLAVALFCVSACNREDFIEKKTRGEFTVKGVDVSAYQGKIDWKELASNDISFAFIKATEGSTYIDERFDKNIKGIQKTDLACGAYHFMSFESSGKSQAANFISKVDPDMIDLPPVVDVELYGKYHDNPPSFELVEEILGELLAELTEEYGRKPIIYTNLHAYLLYIVGVFDEYDIWMCDLTDEPELYGDTNWKFWQYSHTGILSGYSGGEKHIDMNVFCGTEKEFEKYLKKK